MQTVDERCNEWANLAFLRAVTRRYPRTLAERIERQVAARTCAMLADRIIAERSRDLVAQGVQS